MSQALTSSILHCGDQCFSPSSQMSSFLGPVLLKKDVFFKVDLIRESGKTFQTRRVCAYQLPDVEVGGKKQAKVLLDKIDADIVKQPLLFESTIGFYRTPTNEDIGDLASSDLISNQQPKPNLHIDTTYTLSQVKELIKSGSIKRGKFYGMALNLALALSLQDMLIDIRIPKDQSSNNSGVTQYLISIPGELATEKKIVLPYISDCMTQVLACADPMDKLWEKWPGKLTVWNYGVWFHRNGPESGSEGDENDSIVDGKKWFIIEYSVSGAEGGLVQGANKIYDYPSGQLLSNSSFSALMKP